MWPSTGRSSFKGRLWGRGGGDGRGWLRHVSDTSVTDSTTWYRCQTNTTLFLVRSRGSTGGSARLQEADPCSELDTVTYSEGRKNTEVKGRAQVMQNKLFLDRCGLRLAIVSKSIFSVPLEKLKRSVYNFLVSDFMSFLSLSHHIHCSVLLPVSALDSHWNTVVELQPGDVPEPEHDARSVRPADALS